MGNDTENTTSPLAWCWTTTYIVVPLPNLIKTTAIFTAFLTALLTLLSMLGNSLYILVYIKYRRFQTVSNLLLLNVSVIGFLLSCTSQPMFVIRCFFEVYATYNCILWEFQHLSFLYLTCVYFLTIFLISFDRFLATFVPLRYAAIFNQSRITLCVILAWCISFIITSSVVFGYFIFYAVICPLFILTKILVVAIYMRILRQARFQRRKIQNQFPRTKVTEEKNANNNNNDTNIREKKAEKTVLTVVVLLLITALPALVFVIVVLTSKYDFKLAYLYGNVSETAIFLAATLSPFVYCWRNNEIRKAMVCYLRKREFETESSTL
ncbi:trace amine-associated receptor 4-like [Dendronephthya gigantea]|uniref:trace amine-associated receptor 4-like n=1 Tax=Dendronephthya gigantea TaxID=151771 RepID=UPI00106C91F6|nr:trace amine-associated receptor 4-like [Dendronephthya gigantea]